MAYPVPASGPTGKATSDFDRLQSEYFEDVTGYLHPAHPTAQAFVLPKLNYICSRLPDVRSVLDVGAGNGTFTYYWQQRAHTVEGLELSHNLIARSPCADRLRQGNAYALPYADNTFDLVFESNLLHHLSDPLKALAEMRRVARNYVVCIEPNRNNPPMFVFSLLLPVERRGLKFSTRYVERLMNRAGLQKLASRTTGMISQHRTPVWTLPFLRVFDHRCPLGMYSIVIARKPEE